MDRQLGVQAMPSIIVTSPNEEEKYFQLGRRTIVVGRAEQYPVQVKDELVSQRHMQIRFDQADQAYFALDMHSKNGTKVKGRRIDGDVRLEDGDVIEIGHSTIVFYARDFVDRSDAFRHHKQAGLRGQPTETWKP
jgi:pSer/pThr/pTyr-binding forkhead associated (FHA) protein